MSDTPVFLMTDPSAYEVAYKINPWMAPEAWSRDAAGNRRRAGEASRKLAAALKAAPARVITMEGAAGLPDMVFPANSAVVLDGKVMVARFRYPERQGEERHFLHEFGELRRQGVVAQVSQFPKGCFQEGAGDCIWDATRQLFWAGFGPRSSAAAIDVIEETFAVPTIRLELATSRFYHLDTCFIPLSGGEVLYFPPAFSAAALAAIRDRVPPDLRIEASEEDASHFAVNAVSIGRQIVMAEPPARLADALRERGYSVVGLDLRPFLMSGGGAYCMTLRLDLKRSMKPAALSAAAA